LDKYETALKKLKSEVKTKNGVIIIRITMENIGMIGQAEVEVKGLTVIAGENDTGKSTIGKLLYSIVRAFSKYEEEFEADRIRLLGDSAELIYFELRSNIDFDRYNELRRSFGIDFRRELLAAFESGEPDSMLEIIQNRREMVEKLQLDEKTKDSVSMRFRDMEELLHLENGDIRVKKQALNKVLSSEFEGQISNRITQKDANVIGAEGSNEIFSLKFKDDEVSELKYSDQIYFNESVYVESPFVLQLSQNRPIKLGGSRSALFGNSPYPLHVNDLLALLNQKPVSNYSIFDVLNEGSGGREKMSKIISEIIDGKFALDQKNKEFVYKKEGIAPDVSFKINNIATGVKQFGVLQLLLNTEVLSKRSLIIIDEPEVHLHPSWQVDYAKLLVLLIRELHVNIIINSHSPYFIEALKVFSDKYKLEEETEFYLMEKSDSGLSSLNKVTDNLESVFHKLTEPFKRLEIEAIDDDN
jgi:predicted ATPase